MKPQDFENGKPLLLIENYFAGRTKAWGIFQDRYGRVRRQFEVDIAGSWDGQQLTLVEDFCYSDKKTERRVWQIVKHGPSDYVGVADGVVGIANGTAHGNALNWHYRFALQVGNRSLIVKFDDWMVLQPDGILINRTEVTKFGFKLGELTLFFSKSAQNPETMIDRAAE